MKLSRFAALAILAGATGCFGGNGAKSSSSSSAAASTASASASVSSSGGTTQSASSSGTAGTSGSATSGSGTTTGGTSSSSSSGTTGGTVALCGSCSANGECQSGYCDRATHTCNVANPCASSADCGGSLACDTQSGNCICPGVTTASSSSGTTTSSTGTSTGSTGSSTGTSGTTSGSVGLCGGCSANSDCQSGYCDRATHTCNAANACTSAADCGGSLACDTQSGNCICPGVTTASSSSSSSSSSASSSSSGTTGGGSTGTSSSSSAGSTGTSSSSSASSSSGTTGSFTAGLSIVSGNNQTAFLDQAENPVTVALKDSSGAAIPGAAIVVSSPSGAAASPAVGNTDLNGRFTFTPFVGRAPKAYAFTISTPDGGAGDIGLTGTAVEPDAGTTFTLVNLNHSQGNSPNPAAGTQALTGSIRGFRQISDGTIYFADPSYAVVRKLSPDGELTVVAGIPASAGFSGDNGLAIAAQLNNPYDVEVDETNQVLYIADTSNSRIRAVDLSTGIITTVAGGGSAPSPGYGDSGVGTAAQVQCRNLALGPNNLLVFPDQISQRIRSLNTQTGIVNNWLQQPTFNSSQCNVGSITLAFYSASDPDSQVIFDAAGNAYVSANFYGDAVNAHATPCYVQGGAPTAVVKITPGGTMTALVGAVNGQSSEGTWSAAYTFNGAPYVAVDPAGNLYLSEPNRHRIMWMDAGSGRMLTFSGTGSPGYAGDYAPFAPGIQYNSPTRIAFDANGNLLVADTYNYALRVLWNVARHTRLVSTLSIVGGNNASTVVDQAGVQMKTKLVDSDGTPLVGYRIQYSITDPGGGLYATSALTDAAGTAKVLNNAGLATGPYHFQASFTDPYGNQVQNSPVTFTLNATATAADNIFAIVNVGHSSGNSPVPPAVPAHAPNNGVMSNVGAVRGFRQTSDGTIYFADPSYAVVRKLSASGELTVVAGIPASAGFAGDNALAIAAQLNNPYDVEVDETNQVLYIADTSNSRIRAVDLISGIITTVAGGGSAPSPGYGDSGVGTSAQVQCRNLALGPNNLLVFPDQISQRIRSLNTQTGIVNNWLQQPTFNSSQCNVGSITLAFYSAGDPDSQVIFDAAGNAYVSANFYGDALNAHATPCYVQGGAPTAVVKITPGGTMTALVGSNSSWSCGASTCNGSYAPGTAAGIYYFNGAPYLARDGNGLLYLSEYNRNRVMYKDASGNIQLYSGNGNPGYAGDYVPRDGSGGAVQYNGPTHIGFLAPNGRFTIADTYNYTLRMVWQ